MTKAELERALGIDTIDFTGEEAPDPSKKAKPSGETTKKPAEAKPAPVQQEPKIVSAEAEKTVAAATGAPSETPDALREAADTTEITPLADTLETEAVKPKEPPLKKTWTNHDLLIDEALGQLPLTYERDRAVLLIRDPFWMHTYWDISDESVVRARQEGGERLALRVHDVTDTLFNGSNSHFSFDILMPFEGQRVWYINAPTDGRTYLVQVGYLRADNRFIVLATTNPGAMPRARVSDVVVDRFVAIDYDRPLSAEYPVASGSSSAPSPTRQPAETPWALPPEARSGTDVSEQMYQLSLRGTPYWSADIPKFGDYQQAMRTLSSQSLSSWALSSPQAAPKPQSESAKKKDFWLVADCELIVYGATEPDAKVTIRGQAIELRADGTFTLRFALPNGLHPIPIHALNADEDMERAITITVSRDTAVSV